MRLGELIAGLDEKTLTGDPSLEIAGLTYDSRAVRPGQVFFAIRGFKVDGHAFIGQAVTAGAAAIVGEDDLTLSGAAYVRVPDSRLAMALMAARFYGDPTKRLRLIGVTGTKGKTTTTTLVRQILTYAGTKCGLIGSNVNLVGDREVKAIRTTPESLDLQALFADMVSEGCQACVMEVASHALVLKRVAGCEYDIGVLTNIARDHLDFHETIENYIAAKELLFRDLGATYRGELKGFPKAAIVNADDAVSARMAAASRVPVITYGIDRPADFRATDIVQSHSGVSYTLEMGSVRMSISLRLMGRVNVYNSLCAFAIASAAGVDAEVIRAALAAAKPVEGRFEPVDAGQPFTVLVDYSHNESSLENVLLLARDFARDTSGRVIVVFGCGGDRDAGKRPGMGRLAVTLADHAVITSDNPRSEDPETILDDIEAGIREVGQPSPHDRITDRRAAIARALGLARRGDVVVIAGKGHETYQILKDKTVHFDDREVARELLSGRG